LDGVNKAFVEGNGVYVIAGFGEQDIEDFFPKGITRKQQKEAEASALRDAQKAERAADNADTLETSPAAAWVKTVFGDSFANQSNQAALVRFLDGTDAKFQGLVGWTWEDGFQKLGFTQEQLRGVSVPDLMDLLKKAYTSGRANPYHPSASPWLVQRAVIAEHRTLATAARRRAHYDVEEAGVAEYHDAEVARLEAELAAGRGRAGRRRNPRAADEVFVEAYHGGSAPIRKFDPSKSVDNSFWFSEDKDKILRGESGAASVKWLMTVRLRVSKTAGYDEYDRYFLTQLQDMGYDSVHLDDDWIILDPSRIEVVNVKRVSDRENPAARFDDADADEVDDWVTIEECGCHACVPARMNPRAAKRTATGAYADLDSVTLVITNALAKHGLSMNNILAVKFTRGGKSRGGACSYSRSLNKCQIMFNGLAWPAFTEEQRLNTVLHEAAHAIQFLTTGTSDHGPKWQKIAKSIGCSGDSCMSLEASQAMVDAYAEAKGLEKRKIITREDAEAARADFAVGDYVSFDHKRERWFGKIVSRGPMHATVMIQSPRQGITGKIPYPSLQKEAPPRHAEKVAGVDKPAPGESITAWQARTGRGVR
jgi:hypothetical protein